MHYVCIIYVMNASGMYHRCIILEERPRAVPLNVGRPVLEDEGKYIALSQLVSKMHHEYIMNVS